MPWDLSDPNSVEMAKSKKRYTPHGDCHGNNRTRAQGPKCVEPTGASRLPCICRDQGWVHDGGHRHSLSWCGSRGLEWGERVARRRETCGPGRDVDGIEHDV